MNDSVLRSYLDEKGWTIAFEEERSARAAEFCAYSGLGLSTSSLRALASFDRGIYTHQKEGIQRYLAGENLAVTTSTASGKTLIFNVCALEELARNESSRIIAVYPLKALATEQEDRWKKLLQQAGVPAKVGRIDGSVYMDSRLKILKESRVLVMTPDIIHAWLLSSIQSPPVLDLLRNLSLVVIDEAHTYSGVFGSNSAFLFRRLLHASRKLGATVRYIASSATMDQPSEHLFRLTGEPFMVVGPEMDTSPRSQLLTILANPPDASDTITSMSDLIAFAATQTDHQSITFVDSRKQTEYLASIIDRKVTEDGEDNDQLNYDRLKELSIYPYRSGYEEEDRLHIQKRLATGDLRGVVSTSALEMGIDLPHLSLGLLFGVPRSATSYFQRVGRVGRKTGGVIIVVNNGSVVSESIFRDPSKIQSMPLIQSALYLNNQRIQYIHAMCLARQGGEDEVVNQAKGVTSDRFLPAAQMPDEFTDLCNSERVGEIDTELQTMKAQAGDDPHHTFPLRDLDVQYHVEFRHGPTIDRLGSLSQSQLMREAYPGAVYYYQTRPYRVVRIRKQQRTVDVRQEKRYFTRPTLLPTLILPNLVGDNVYQSARFGGMLAIECGMQIGEAVTGFKERRGKSEIDIHYPLDHNTGYFPSPRFQRYFFTSGVVLTHPALVLEHVRASTISEIVAHPVPRTQVCVTPRPLPGRDFRSSFFASALGTGPCSSQATSTRCRVPRSPPRPAGPPQRS